MINGLSECKKDIFKNWPNANKWGCTYEMSISFKVESYFKSYPSDSLPLGTRTRSLGSNPIWMCRFPTNFLYVDSNVQGYSDHWSQNFKLKLLIFHQHHHWSHRAKASPYPYWYPDWPPGSALYAAASRILYQIVSPAFCMDILRCTCFDDDTLVKQGHRGHPRLLLPL